MPTAGIAGRSGRFSVGATTSALAVIGEIRDYRVNPTHRPIDATSNDSSGWDESIKGQQAWTATFEAIYASSEADQKVVRKMFSTANSKYFMIQPSSSKTAKFVGRGWLANYTVGGPTQDAVIFNGEITGSGPLTYST